MSKAAGRSPVGHFQAADLRAAARLATQATAGVARIAEGVHQSVWSSMGVPGGRRPGSTRGITGLVYKTVHGVNTAVGAGVDLLLARLVPLLDAVSPPKPSSTEREAVLAALNGVLGDQLAASGNPLATPMQFRVHGRVLNTRTMGALRHGTVTGKVLLLVHGLCMNDLQWRSQPGTEDDADGAGGFDHGLALSRSLGYTPVYLRYNTGLHVSENGRLLAERLRELVAHWPQPVLELSILAHSMGGLVARSACHYAAQSDHTPAGASAPPHPGDWLGRLRNIVFLGTPHHGAPMERAGNWIDVVLGSNRYSAPFARLGQLRSAGITDLRYGLVLDADWHGRNRFQRAPDRRQPLPLPPGVACFAVAATTAAKSSLAAERLLGDGLVPLRSALGQHDKPELCLAFAGPAQRTMYRMNHWGLLRSRAVATQVERWLAGG